MTALDLAIISLLAAKCPVPEIKNKSKLEWTERDSLQLRFSANRCKEIYSEKHCLSKFYKIGFQNYIAMCKKVLK